jgi:hypothetical protein
MIEKKRYVSSAALLRSLFEYYIELLFLSEHQENYKQRQLDAEREQQKIVNAIENSSEPDLAKLKTDRRFELKKNDLNNDLKDHSPETTQSLCDKVGYKWMYDTVYRCLSPIAHPNIINYSNIYFKANSSGKMLEYDPTPQLNEEDSIQRLVLLSNILVNSTKCIHHLLPNCNTPAIEAQLEKFVHELEKATPKPLTEQ